MREPDKIVFTVTDCLRKIDARLSEAVGIVRAGLACAESGRDGEAIKIIVDVEQLTYEADKMLQMASMMRRLHKN